MLVFCPLLKYSSIQNNIVTTHPIITGYGKPLKIETLIILAISNLVTHHVEVNTILRGRNYYCKMLR